MNTLKGGSGAGPAPMLPAGARCVTESGAEPSPTGVRRLSRRELETTMADLVGTSAAAAELEADPQTGGFSTNRDRSVSAGDADRLAHMAELAAAEFRKTVAPPQFAAECFAGPEGAALCAQKFIGDWGRRAFRRPLEEREQSALLTVYRAGHDGAEGDAAERFRAGLAWVVQAVLQSPQLLYRPELGRADAPSGSTITLTSHEVASALSYGLLASPPDPALWAAADAGQLQTPEAIAEHARRLMNEHLGRFQAQVRSFVHEWLRIDFDNPEWEKKPSAYPLFSPDLKQALARETAAFLDDWVAGGPTLPRLLTASESFLDSASAPVYGRTVSGSQPVKTPLDPKQRAGILTQASFLGTHAHPDSSSPTLRALVVMDSVLCRQAPQVPADVPPLPPVDGTKTRTTRERFAAHVSAPTCAACHSLIDPLGFPFESYDGLGVFRTEENGVPVDTRGAIVGTAKSDRPVADAVELTTALAASSDVHVCLARQVFRFLAGRREQPFDECAIQQAARAFSDDKLDLRTLFAATVAAPSFHTRRISQEP